MTRRCYLHVGSPKTGTTFLQDVMWASRRALSAQGLRLPLRRVDHFFLTLQLRDRVDPDLDPPKAGTVLERLGHALAEDRARGEHDLLLSHELLAVVSPAGINRLMELLDGYELHVVLTVRDLGRQLPSEWQQFVKTRHSGSFERFLRHVRDNADHRFWEGQDFAGVAARWGAGLPPEHVHVVTVPGSGSAGGSLLERFCAVLGVDPTTLESGSRRANPSLGYEQAELLRRVNRAIGEDFETRRAQYADVVKFWFAEKILASQAGLPLALPAYHHDWCLAKSQAQIEALRGAGYDIVGDLDDLLPAPPSAEGDLTAGDPRLLEIAIHAIAGMLAQRAEDRAQIRELRKELASERREQRAPTPGPVKAPATRHVAPAGPRFATRLRGWAGRARR